MEYGIENTVIAFMENFIEYHKTTNSLFIKNREFVIAALF